MTTAKQRERLKALGWDIMVEYPDYQWWRSRKKSDTYLYTYKKPVFGGLLEEAVEFAAVLKEGT